MEQPSISGDVIIVAYSFLAAFKVGTSCSVIWLGIVMTCIYLYFYFPAFFSCCNDNDVYSPITLEVLIINIYESALYKLYG